MRVFGIVALVALVGCSPIWEGKAQGEKITALEKRVTDLENAKAAGKVQDQDRQAKMKECIAQADLDYWDYLRRNGTVNRNGSIQTPIVIAEQALKIKEARIRECQILYGR